MLESPIYKVDDILLLESLIKYGCVKILTTFCCTHKHFYKIFRRNREKYYKKMLYLQHISPHYFEKFSTLENMTKVFDFDDYKINTNYYSLISKSDICGCMNKYNIIHMKIPRGHWKYTKLKGYSKGEYFGDYMVNPIYYTLYPSNDNLVISTSKNIEEKKLLDINLIDMDYFTFFPSESICKSKDDKYLNKCKNL